MSIPHPNEREEPSCKPKNRMRTCTAQAEKKLRQHIWYFLKRGTASKGDAGVIAFLCLLFPYCLGFPWKDCPVLSARQLIWSSRITDSRAIGSGLVCID